MSHPTPPFVAVRRRRLAAAFTLMLVCFASSAVAAAAAPIAAGSSHFCAITDTRALACWGENDSGQLGTGDAVDRRTPTTVPGLSDVRSVDADGPRTCATTGLGNLWCWGLSTPEPGRVAPQLTPVQQPGVSDVVDAEVMPDYSVCALLRTGTVSCHQGNRDAAGVWRAPNVGSGIAELSGTCARSIRRKVVCWNAWEPTKAAVEVRGLRGAIAITQAPSNLCGTFRDGTVRCSGEVPVFTGTGETSDRRVLRVPGVSDATGLGTGDLLCVLRHGRATCTDVLHEVDTRRSPTGGRRVIAGLDDATAIASTSSSSCALRKTGAIACWGPGVHTTGTGNIGVSTTPIEVPGVTDVASLSAGDRHTCALGANGRVRCWGGVGFGTQSSRAVLSPTNVEGLRRTVALVSGPHAACAVSIERVVRCWGPAGPGATRYFDATKVGVLPRGAETPPRMPGCFPVDGNVRCASLVAARGQRARLRLTSQTAAGFEGATSVASSWGFDCAVTANGGVSCRGTGYLYPPERGSVASGPTPLPGITNAVRVATAETGGCALLADKTVTCWGAIARDDAESTSSPLPADGAPVPGFNDIRAFTATGAGGLCAVTESGSVLCAKPPSVWFDGSSAATPQPGPYVMPGITDAIDIVGGLDHTCVLRATKTVACWGAGWGGALGDGAAPTGHGPQSRPYDVPGLSGQADL